MFEDGAEKALLEKAFVMSQIFQRLPVSANSTWNQQEGGPLTLRRSRSFGKTIGASAVKAHNPSVVA